MKFLAAYCVLPLFPALVLGSGQGYEDLERQLKEVFKERSNILHQLLKTSKELQGIKVNLQSLKNDEASTKNDVQKLLEMGQNQREMKSLQEAFQKQLNEAAEKAEKQQATVALFSWTPYLHFCMTPISLKCFLLDFAVFTQVHIHSRMNEKVRYEKRPEGALQQERDHLAACKMAAAEIGGIAHGSAIFPYGTRLPGAAILLYGQLLRAISALKEEICEEFLRYRGLCEGKGSPSAPGSSPPVSSNLLKAKLCLLRLKIAAEPLSPPRWHWAPSHQHRAALCPYFRCLRWLRTWRSQCDCAAPGCAIFLLPLFAVAAHFAYFVTLTNKLFWLFLSHSHNKSLKNKLLSGNKLCGMHTEESKKIQAQLKELRYGKKDLIFKAQQLTDLEQKLSVAKDKLENAALDKESQLKALKETVQLCLSSVLHSQPPTVSLSSSKPAEKLPSSSAKGSKAPSLGTSTKVWQNVSAEKKNFPVALKKEENQSTQECDSQDVRLAHLKNKA
uniref:leucine zipper protein 2 n=1 Tax=Lonchura striata TaxID=40157 RepID=UPI001293C68B|nr:leucine zipper protein 2 [Lonchura striata domestica]